MDLRGSKLYRHAIVMSHRFYYKYSETFTPYRTSSNIWPCRFYNLLTCPKPAQHHKNLDNFDPLKPHFYIVKLGFTWVYIVFFSFLYLLINIDCGYSLEPPRQSGSNEYPQSMFWAEIWKKKSVFFLIIIWKLSVFGSEIFNIFEQACFRNEELQTL